MFPFQLALGWWNDKRGVFDSGEIGFWGTVIFLAAEMIYLGAVR
ncbi:MAG: hypothetical protein AB7F76_04995 [Parvibaculaceae bacterium]